MAEVTIVNIQQFKQTDYALTFIVKGIDPNNTKKRIPLDISGWQFKWSCKDTDDPTSTEYIVKDTAGGKIVVNGDQVGFKGYLSFTIRAADTAAMVIRNYRHGMKRTDSGAETLEMKGDYDLLESIILT